jgi:glycogen debranching enzyme
VKILVEDRFYESIEFENFHDAEVRCELLLMVSVDFRDIFELRGLQRAERGELLPPEAGRQGILFRYRGKDGRERATRISVDAPLEPFSATGFLHPITLAPGERTRLEVTVGCASSGASRRRHGSATTKPRMPDGRPSARGSTGKRRSILTTTSSTS